ncbi:hypothetical protein RJ55_05963 [Drechmeria coniospora]|nr:hypothetical protein RJ55_05963 [Drechmeria coniospora]
MPPAPMTLTPVHVRGKRKSSAKTAVPLILQRPERKKRRTIGSVVASRAARPRLTLDSLPSEVLELILLYSSSLSLPRASPVIGIKLSHPATLLRQFIWAFHDTWQQGFGIPVSQPVHYVPGEEEVPKGQSKIPCHGDHQLQTAILELPWVKIDFILQAQQIWADRYAHDRWYTHCTPWLDQFSSRDHSREGGFAHFDSRRCFEADYQQALKWPSFFVEPTTWHSQDVHPLTRMPIHLITGPWDDEKLRRLFWLTRGGITYDADGQTLPPWEVRMQCLENTILSAAAPNALVSNCLMGDWMFRDLPPDVVRSRLANFDWNSATQAGSSQGLARILDGSRHHALGIFP